MRQQHLGDECCGALDDLHAVLELEVRQRPRSHGQALDLVAQLDVLFQERLRAADAQFGVLPIGTPAVGVQSNRSSVGCATHDRLRID
jgi:hypothetical protein